MSEPRTIFKKVDYDVSGLLHYIDIGDIGLPDIQRPFVWKATKVRDLFDSMYRGFPIGYLLFWANQNVNGARTIGRGEKQHTVPKLLIVDGQQRLTSLYAVFRGQQVLTENYEYTTLEIAFRPSDCKFEVCDAAIRRDPEFIPNISKLWASGKSSHGLVRDFLKQLSEKRQLSEDEEERIAHNLDRLFDLQKYPFTALEISPSVDEEQVAYIFVRINNEGVKLNQADFILTLLSVFWDEGRAELEQFSRQSRIPPTKGDKPSPFNHFIQADPDKLLRVAVAVAFNRGRLKSVYQVLRGKNLQTGEFSAEKREEQFAKLKQAQETALNLTHWHQFFNCLMAAGFRSEDQISSQNTLVYTYVYYLIGKTRYHLPDHVLQHLIGRWFFATTLTGRYTGSQETVMDGDLSRIKDLKSGDEFIDVLEKMMNSSLTRDYWEITLPSELETSSSRSPGLFAYDAALNKLGASALFSKLKVSDLLDPTLKLRKKSLERHHLFPRGYLERNGITDSKLINQVANLAFIEWPDNIRISDQAPAEYMKEMRKRCGDKDLEVMFDFHALPKGWEEMNYSEFLARRRELMADVIRRGFETI